MKSNLFSLLSATFLLTLPTVILAADVSVDSTTMLRIEQRDIIGGDKQKLLPATQFLGIDANKLADGNLSLHFYGWGRTDLDDNSYNSKKSDAGFTYGYLRYRFDAANADIRAGRFFVREGIVNEHIDGINTRTELPLGFGISAFGGAPVHTSDLHLENSDGKGDYIFGGRFNYRFKGILDIGLSGVYEGDAPTLENYANSNHRLVGGDIWITPFKQLELIGHSSYNTEVSAFAEHSYLLNLNPLKQFTLSTEYNEHRERNYLFSWMMFSGAAINPDDKSRSVGTTLSYEIDKGIELAGDYKHYKREQGSADRYGGELKLRVLDNALRMGLAYHYLTAGEAFAIGTNPSASYHEIRTYALHDTKSYFAAVDLLGFFFKDKIYDKSSALEAVLSLGYHISPELALSGDISFGRNPEFTEDTKGLIRLTYNPVFSGKGVKK